MEDRQAVAAAILPALRGICLRTDGRSRTMRITGPLDFAGSPGSRTLSRSALPARITFLRTRICPILIGWNPQVSLDVLKNGSSIRQ